MLRIEGWNYFPQRLTNESTPKCCYPINIGDDIVVLLFEGEYFSYERSPIGIIVLKDNQAKLVFNKRFKICELKKTNEDVKFVLQENIVQYYDIGKPDREPILKTLSISKDCISLE